MSFRLAAFDLRLTHGLFALAIAAGFTAVSHAQPAESATATTAEAEARLKTLVSLFKAKGNAAGPEVMAADDPAKCRYKDVVCMVVDTKDDTIVVQTALPRLVGQKFDYEVRDPDGVVIGDQLAGPAKRGATKWEASWKFARPDTKKITPRWATCAKSGATHAVCVSINQP